MNGIDNQGPSGHRLPRAVDDGCSRLQRIPFPKSEGGSEYDGPIAVSTSPFCTDV
jgi:hypothetical protein